MVSINNVNSECLLRGICLKRLKTSISLSVRTTDNPVENIIECVANTNREHYHDTNIFRKQIKNITPVFKTQLQNITTTPLYQTHIESVTTTQIFTTVRTIYELNVHTIMRNGR